jgi:hypothetical protein
MPNTLTFDTDQMAQLIAQLRSGDSGNPKIEDPEFFRGRRDKLRSFITQCELKFNCEPGKFDTDSKKVHFTSGRCRDDAWLWVELTIKNGVSSYTTWENFRAAITKAFGEADSRDVARRKLKDCKQGSRSAATYWDEFQRITADLDYNDATYIDHFVDGCHGP